jgi:hypothetical protein
MFRGQIERPAMGASPVLFKDFYQSGLQVLVAERGAVASRAVNSAVNSSKN